MSEAAKRLFGWVGVGLAATAIVKLLLSVYVQQAAAQDAEGPVSNVLYLRVRTATLRRLLHACVLAMQPHSSLPVLRRSRACFCRETPRSSRSARRNRVTPRRRRHSSKILTASRSETTNAT